MSSETTIRHIRVIEGGIDGYWDLSGDGKATNLTGGSDPGAHLASLCQAKLALLQCLEIQERMERDDPRCSCGSKPDWKNRDGRLYCMACWRRYVDENPGARAVNLKLAQSGRVGQDGSAGGGE